MRKSHIDGGIPADVFLGVSAFVFFAASAAPGIGLWRFAGVFAVRCNISREHCRRHRQTSKY
jgi:hypothetical protein